MDDFIKGIVGRKIHSFTGLHGESERVVLNLHCGGIIYIYHSRDCCENVRLVDFENDGIVGGTIISFEEVTHSNDTEYGSFTWTFYKLETTKGGLWLRWLGESNGYYSEKVTCQFYPHNSPENCSEYQA